MSIKNTAKPAYDASPAAKSSPRQVSPEVAEVMHLIGAMERLVDDVATRTDEKDSSKSG